MARTTKATTVTEVESENDTATVEKNKQENKSVTKTASQKVTKKTWNDTDPIKCVSITSGELGMIGIKSGINYTWNTRGDEVEVEYQDVIAAIRSGKKHVIDPLFIIQDHDLVTQFPQVEKIYQSIYSTTDLKEIFNCSVNQMAEIIEQLPKGAKESIKHIASQMISTGELDSVQKIKKLDEIYDTKFMLMTELFD